jgi:hypothetical protein
MGKNYYSFEEIKTKFKYYKELKESNITEEEYGIFCDELQVLPIEIVDKVENEIQFIPLSTDCKKGNPACYVNLRKGVDKEKEGIIVLTPFIFDIFFDKNGKEIRLNNCILHEIAHHILGHYEYKDQRDVKEKENAAWEQVKKWVKQWTGFIAKEEIEAIRIQRS